MIGGSDRHRREEGGVPRSPVEGRASRPFAPHGRTAVAPAAVPLVWSFAGWEAITHMAGEFRSPARVLPRGTTVAVAMVGMLYLTAATSTSTCAADHGNSAEGKPHPVTVCRVTSPSSYVPVRQGAWPSCRSSWVSGRRFACVRCGALPGVRSEPDCPSVQDLSTVGDRGSVGLDGRRGLCGSRVGCSCRVGGHDAGRADRVGVLGAGEGWLGPVLRTACSGCGCRGGTAGRTRGVGQGADGRGRRCPGTGPGAPAAATGGDPPGGSRRGGGIGPAVVRGGAGRVTHLRQPGQWRGEPRSGLPGVAHPWRHHLPCPVGADSCFGPCGQT
ncbi:amino acid permease [Streptomyces sp. NBC_00820]|uniref:amino acid permease n=1 Tax=Streptomyces sp. NBC_00820 TaxID=2975842 RepID=UPI002ED62513|nr:amino acid permease [Streptomyces sp. NBC_00820]